MSLTLKTAHLNALSLKCFALLLGYGLWHIISQPYKVHSTITVPLSFYNMSKHHILHAPDTVTVQIYGPRKSMFTAARTSTIHCDAHQLTPGVHTIKLSDEQIFLPEGVTLVHYIPSKVTVTIT